MTEAAIDKTPKLAKTIGMREDAINALHLPQESITDMFNKTRRGWLWDNVAARSARMGGIVSLLCTFNGSLNVLPGVGLFLLGIVSERIFEGKDKRKTVRKKLDRQAQDLLVTLNPEAAAVQKHEQTEYLAKKTDIRKEVINAAEIPAETLSSMFNRVSRSDKITYPLAVTALGLMVGGLVAWPFTSAAIAATGILGGLGVGLAGACIDRKDKVGREIRNAAYDKLVALDKPAAPAP